MVRGICASLPKQESDEGALTRIELSTPSLMGRVSNHAEMEVSVLRKEVITEILLHELHIVVMSHCTSWLPRIQEASHLHIHNHDVETATHE